MIRSEDEMPLELFKQGIRADKTREKYTHELRKILCEFFEEMLQGSFEERAVQLVRHGKDNPEWTRDLITSLSRKLRERTGLAPDDPDYLNPTSFSNYFKPLKKLFDMNDVVINWKRIYATYPELDNIGDSAGWSRDDIAKMLVHTRGAMERALILVLASSGMRAGALDTLSWGDLTPVYRAGGRLVLDPGEGSEIACAMLEIYRGSSESYTTFITPEAFAALQEYGREWSERMGRQAGQDDPMFVVMRGRPVRALQGPIRQRLNHVVVKAGLRGGKQGRRYKIPMMNGFRRFFNKTTKDAPMPDTAGARIRTEYMMGHKGEGPLDRNYYKTNELELAAAYVLAVPDLTINDSDRLKLSNMRISNNLRQAESEKDEELVNMKEEMASMKEEMARRDKEIEELRSSRGLPGSDLVDALRDAAGKKGVPGPVIESLTGMMDQLKESQETAIREVRAESAAEMAELRRELDLEKRKSLR